METVSQQINQQRAQRIATEAVAWSAGWGSLAAFLTANPDIAELADVATLAVHVHLSLTSNPAERLADYTTRAVEAGAVATAYQNANYGGVRLKWGPVRLDVYDRVERVCEMVTVESVQWRLPQVPGVAE